MKTLFKLFLFVMLFSPSLRAQNYPFQVQVTGSGTPVLLFPGFTCTGAVWDETVATLSKNYECHVFTFAGFGDVPPIDFPWLPKLKEGIETYISNNHLEKPDIIGHSLGATLGLWLAADHPENYAQVIVVDALPSAGALMIPNYKSELIQYDTPYTRQMLEQTPEEFQKSAAQFAGFMSLNKEKHHQIEQWILDADRKTYVYGYVDLLKLDLREDIARITIPVTVLAATHPNREMMESNYKKQYAKLPDTDFRFAENAAHFIMYDNPQWFMDQVTQIMAKGD